MELKSNVEGGLRRADCLEKTIGVLCFLLVVSWCIFFNLNQLQKHVMYRCCMLLVEV